RAARARRGGLGRTGAGDGTASGKPGADAACLRAAQPGAHRAARARRGGLGRTGAGDGTASGKPGADAVCLRPVRDPGHSRW
ncbi:MAG: hypothetical protein LBE08_05620, partial [Bifidobacteriaceae bacterium]|nr:hypothetical protein [Bifidobacteriaceae bacterium]